MLCGIKGEKKHEIGDRFYVNMFNWSEYNERLVRQGEMLFNLDFVENMDKELEEMNKEKKGHPYIYPNSLFRFPGYLYIIFPPLQNFRGNM